MSTLQEALENALDDAPNQAAVQIVTKRCQEKGVKLSARQRELFLERLRAGEDTFRVGEGLTVMLADDDAVAVEECIAAFGDKLPQLTREIGEALSGSILETFRGQWADHSQQLDRERRGFVRRLDARWGQPLSLLRMVLAISQEFGNMTSEEISKRGEDAALRLLVLARLHARACQVCDEIICLLASGFADGAMARWRTLHEISVVALFIREHGETTARRYVDHALIETYKAALTYRRYSDRLGYAPMAEEDFEATRRARDEVAARYESRFIKGDYGWAGAALDIEQPNLANIEESVNMDHLRPYFKLACQNVHAGSKGSIDRLGLPSGSSVLLAGPSNAGLSDPGQNAAISLYRSSVALGLLEPTFDSLVGLRILETLTDDICQAFHAAATQMKEDAQEGMTEG
jgi:Family of unknown function (DUF5677)